jgi:regulator of sigma E protease
MSFVLAIVGLGLLVLVHEAGHFFASLAVGLRPRRFYIGFPPPLVRRMRNGIEYGVGVVPLGGFVTIPGMHKPIGHDAERRFSQAIEEAPSLVGPADRVRRALDADDAEGATAALDELEQALLRQRVSPRAAQAAGKGLTELRDALGPDAYWKAATWRRLVAIGAGPVANVLLALVLLTALFMTSSGKATSVVGSVAPTLLDTKGKTIVSPAHTAGLQPGDRVVSIDGRAVKSGDIAARVSASEGRPIVLTVVRNGGLIRIGPVSPQPTSDGYRLGLVLRGAGLGPLAAAGQAFRVTGLVTGDIGRSLGRLAVGKGRRDVSSPIGIVQASSDSAQQGAGSYLWVLALISLSLALLNLLPLLPLDGGHILFTLIEGARGRFVRREVYERVSIVGLAVVLLLFFIGLSNDIHRLS